ncbi:uncharacterized protein A1O9_04039 [Exophiala aquamarina CBS 119918]|uniref:Uncharacterized protein n=1 Tax=Exophiala aquamarina CBS 119918 TaxID=1182545 RepID=A0A072PUJ3_9EURO|nr:uncharacterized protein A1O9_04039 [Exophiala aquamarina CBS 119918]KEF59195.1 hypothetical protein A1O9_04039 [Exophiala aquamarina CBS 119918]
MTTAIASGMSVPGSFLPSDNESTSSFHCVPFKSSLFLPPAKDSPSSASSLTTSRPAQSISKSHAALSTQSRKRPRVEPKDEEFQTPHNRSYNHNNDNSIDAPSPSPFVNTDYRFAGGVEAPADLNSQRADYEREYEYEHDCRPNRYTSQQVLSRQPSGPRFPHTPSSAQAKRRLSQSPKGGWGKTVWALTGNVAGKVFNFCWQSATSFKGFYAGGGNGYHFDTGKPGVATHGWLDVDSKEDVFHTDYSVPRGCRERESTPVPGEFPAEPSEFIEDYMSQPWRYGSDNDYTPTARPILPASRSSWVVVDGPSMSSRDTSPVRKKSRASVAPLSNSARPSPRNIGGNSSGTTRPRLTSRSSTNKSAASIASPRASLASGQLGPSHAQSRQSLLTSPDNFQSTARRQSSRASLASSRRQSSHLMATATSNNQSSPEVRKFEQKLRRKEAKEDESIRRLNEQLKAMIQEGKQALSSKIEVVDGSDEDIDCDEGFVDGDEAWERDYVRPHIWS